MSTLSIQGDGPRAADNRAGQIPAHEAEGFAAARRRARPADAETKDAARARRIARLTWLGAFMDSAIEIPGLKFRIGLDPLIGLVPGVGDLASDVIALYIVFEAWRLGATRKQLAMMLGNVLLDTLVGSVPVLGDIFDFAFKANVRNLRLLGIDCGGPKPDPGGPRRNRSH